jgi:hypothetical protein
LFAPFLQNESKNKINKRNYNKMQMQKAHNLNESKKRRSPQQEKKNIDSKFTL